MTLEDLIKEYFESKGDELIDLQTIADDLGLKKKSVQQVCNRLYNLNVLRKKRSGMNMTYGKSIESDDVLKDAHRKFLFMARCR